MKFITRALLALFLITPLLAHADQASKQAKAEEIMQLTHVDQLMKRVMDQMTQRMQASATEQSARMHLTPDQQTAFSDYQAKLNQLITNSVSWDKIKPIMVKVYTETYTDEELDGILAFYRTPVGQSMIAKNPELMSKSMTLMMQQMSTLQPQIEQLSKDFATKMQQSTRTPAPATSTSAPAK
jgi:hypothetical protein